MQVNFCFEDLKEFLIEIKSRAKGRIYVLQQRLLVVSLPGDDVIT